MVLNYMAVNYRQAEEWFKYQPTLNWKFFIKNDIIKQIICKPAILSCFLPF